MHMHPLAGGAKRDQAAGAQRGQYQQTESEKADNVELAGSPSHRNGLQLTSLKGVSSLRNTLAVSSALVGYASA